MEHPHSSSPGGLQLWKHRGWGNFIWPASIAVLSGEQIQWPWCAGCGVFRSYKACLHRNLIRLLSGKGVDIRKPEMHLKQLSSPAKSGVFKAHKWAARLLAVCFGEAALMHPRSREPPLLFFPDGGCRQEWRDVEQELLPYTLCFCAHWPEWVNCTLNGPSVTRVCNEHGITSFCHLLLLFLSSFL